MSIRDHVRTSYWVACEACDHLEECEMDEDKNEFMQRLQDEGWKSSGKKTVLYNREFGILQDLACPECFRFCTNEAR